MNYLATFRVFPKILGEKVTVLPSASARSRLIYNLRPSHFFPSSAVSNFFSMESLMCSKVLLLRVMQAERTCAAEIILTGSEWTPFGILIGINHPPLFQNDVSFQTYWIPSESSRWYVYMKSFESDLVFFNLIICVLVNIARVRLAMKQHRVHVIHQTVATSSQTGKPERSATRKESFVDVYCSVMVHGLFSWH